MTWSVVVSLTHDFRSAKQWRGPLPEDMLAKLWTPGLMHDGAMPAMQCEVDAFLMHPILLCHAASALQPVLVRLQGMSMHAAFW